MKRILLFAILLMSTLGFAQTFTTYEKPPVFNDCDSEAVDQIKIVFQFYLEYIYL